MNWEVGKIYKLLGGGQAKIYELHGLSPLCIYGATKSHDGWALMRWDKDGKGCTAENVLTTVLCPEPKARWLAWGFPNPCSAEKRLAVEFFQEMNSPESQQWSRMPWLDPPDYWQPMGKI